MCSTTQFPDRNLVQRQWSVLHHIMCGDVKVTWKGGRLKSNRDPDRNSVQRQWSVLTPYNVFRIQSDTRLHNTRRIVSVIRQTTRFTKLHSSSFLLFTLCNVHLEWSERKASGRRARCRMCLDCLAKFDAAFEEYVQEVNTRWRHSLDHQSPLMSCVRATMNNNCSKIKQVL